MTENINIKIKRGITFCMVLIMCLAITNSLIPTSNVKAASNSGTYYGISWTLDNSGTLTLSGTGSAGAATGTKWTAKDVKKVTTSGTVTINGSTGNAENASMNSWFANHTNLTEVSGNYTLIGAKGYQYSGSSWYGTEGCPGGDASTSSMFSGCTSLTTVNANFTLTAGAGSNGVVGEAGNSYSSSLPWADNGSDGGEGGDGGDVSMASMFNGCISLTSFNGTFNLSTGSGGTGAAGGKGGNGKQSVEAGAQGGSGGNGGDSGTIDVQSMFNNCSKLLSSGGTFNFKFGSGGAGGAGGAGGSYGGDGNGGGNGGDSLISANMTSMYKGCTELKEYNTTINITAGSGGNAGAAGAKGSSSWNNGNGYTYSPEAGWIGGQGEVEGKSNTTTMFSGDRNLRTVNLSSLNASYVKTSTNMFSDCIGISSLTTPKAVASPYLPMYEAMYDSKGTKYTSMSVANTTLTLPKYCLTYNYNGGAATNPQYYINTKETLINNPTKTGYTFTGWTGTGLGSLTNPLKIAAGSTGDKEYNANYIPTNYTITYDLGYGHADNVTSYNIESGAFTLNNPERTGYDFIGWTGTGISTPTKEVVVSSGSFGNREYTAHYELKEGYKSGVYYGLSWVMDSNNNLYIEGGNESNEEGTKWDSDVASFSILDGEAVGGIAAKGILGDCKNMTRLDLSNVDVSYMDDVENMLEECTSLLRIIAPLSMGDKRIKLPNVVKAGYEMDTCGWVVSTVDVSDNEFGRPIVDIENEDITIKNSNYIDENDIGKEIIAVLKPVQYQIAFDMCGGTVNGEEERSVNFNVESDTTDLLPQQVKVPTKNGYEFEGYYDKDGNKYYDAKGNRIAQWNRVSEAIEGGVLSAKYVIKPQATPQNTSTEGNSSGSTGSSGAGTGNSGTGAGSSSTGAGGFGGSSGGSSSNSGGSSGGSSSSSGGSVSNIQPVSSYEVLEKLSMSTANASSYSIVVTSVDNDNNVSFDIDTGNSNVFIKSAVILNEQTKDAYIKGNKNSTELKLNKSNDDMGRGNVSTHYSLITLGARNAIQFDKNTQINIDGVEIVHVDYPDKPSDEISFIAKYNGAMGLTIYRLYNPNSGEHFYTDNAKEKDYLAKVGWNYEGVGFIESSNGEPVYRLYNPNGGEHHYTVQSQEKDMLINLGWNYEGVVFYTPSEGGDVYRVYNPNSGEHHYTIDAGEKNWLISLGWKDEGVSWKVKG